MWWDRQGYYAYTKRDYGVSNRVLDSLLPEIVGKVSDCGSNLRGMASEGLCARGLVCARYWNKRARVMGLCACVI